MGLLGFLADQSPKHAGLLAIGLAMGVALYHAAFGFTGAYRKAIVDKDITGITAQAVMLAAAVLLFAPILAQGRAFGHGVTASLAPVSVSMALGAFLFGIGMQVGSGCASGTLFTAGGGNRRMTLVLFFFCAGAFWGSLDLAWWQTLPSMGSVNLAKILGWEVALPLQLGILGLILLGLRLAGGRNKGTLGWQDGFSWRALLRGPWPLLLSAGLLALLNWATLLVAGHAWSITWAFSLWAAKGAVLLGWDATTSGFWSGAFQQGALGRSILWDNTSVMNIGIMLGAFTAASLAGKFGRRVPLPPLSIVAAAAGGLMMGYGARLSYGCNIGAFFSGVASASLHGWVWIACAIPGNVAGIRLRRLFRLDGGQFGKRTT